jgi:hypothetical protein
MHETVLIALHHECMATENCRVCGYRYEVEDPADLPWGADGGCPTYDFCVCCGDEFGYQDASPEGARRWRAQWLEQGTPWDDPSFRPTRWNRDEQLAAVPVPFR